MIKDHVALRRTFGTYRIVIPAREEWDNDWSKRLEKIMSDSQMEPAISKGLGQKFANIVAKYSGTSH